ncbi:hypothetical protein ACEQPO_13190 [Bacillus sp. SL00103]
MNTFQSINLFLQKVDETDTMGTIFQIIADSQIGLGFLTNGQNVPEDILEGSPLELTGIIITNNQARPSGSRKLVHQNQTITPAPLGIADRQAIAVMTVKARVESLT